MIGSNIKSTFFEDSTGIVWFTNSEALHYYNPKTDSLGYIFMVDSAGDTLKSNHSALSLSGNDLYLKAGKELFIYDVAKRCKKKIYHFDSLDTNPILVIQDHNKILLFCLIPSGYEVYLLEDGLQKKWQSKVDGELSAVYLSDSKK